MSDNKLVLITEQFPYGGSETFLETEVLYIAETFPTVLILPTKKTDRRRSMPPNVSVDVTFSDYCEALDENRFLKFLKGIPPLLTHPGFYRQACKHPGRYLNPTGFKRMAMWIREAQRVTRFFKRYITDHKLDTEDTLFYTYWFHLATVGLGDSLKSAKLISRAHGFDLYDERGEPPYSNWKCLGLSNLDKLYLISNNGQNYMNQWYPEFRHKFDVSRLGVKEPGVFSKASGKGEFRLLSVAGVRDVKRLHLIVSAIGILAGQSPGLDIRWDHFGDGPLMTDLKRQVKEELSGKAKVVLHGMVPNTRVMEFYKTNPVDLFINVSSSEGIPVSIMEAQSFGVPVMATDVGGISEIVNDENGVLLTRNPDLNEISKLILDLLDNDDLYLKKRKEAKLHWMQKFNAEKNYSEFSKCLSELLT